MRKLLSCLSILAASAIAGSLPSDAEALSLPGLPSAPSVLLDPALTSVLSSALSTEKVRVIATFKSPLTALQSTTLLSLVSRAQPLRTLPMALIEATPAQIGALKLMSGLVSLYLDKQLTYSMHESVPLIGADQVESDLGYDGSGVTVAVVDSGIDATHADLPAGDKVVKNVKLLGDPVDLTKIVVPLEILNTDTSSGHGTHVAGTVGGLGVASGGYYRGVAPGADLVGIGTGDALFIFTALAAFDWVLANKDAYSIDVVTNSWGTTGAYDPSDPINIASQKINDSGIVVLFAAGNEGPADNTLNPYAVAPWVVNVAAGAKDGVSLADFSSRGISGDPLYHPTLTAPGVDIVSTRALNTVIPLLGAPSDVAGIDPARLPYYTTMSGTSMATPHMAGVVALIRQANPNLQPAAIKQLLIDTAVPMDGYLEHEVGAGYVDAYIATHQAALMP